MITTLIAGTAGMAVVVAAVLALTLRRGRGTTKSLLSLGSVSPQWLQSHRQQEEL